MDSSNPFPCPLLPSTRPPYARRYPTNKTQLVGATTVRCLTPTNVWGLVGEAHNN